MYEIQLNKPIMSLPMFLPIIIISIKRQMPVLANVPGVVEVDLITSLHHKRSFN